MKIATKIKKMNPDRGVAMYRPDQALYKLNPPLEGHTYVVVSSIISTVLHPIGPETYIFASNKDGKITNFSELKGSIRGFCSHEKALKKAGYKIEEKVKVR